MKKRPQILFLMGDEHHDDVTDDGGNEVILTQALHEGLCGWGRRNTSAACNVVQPATLWHRIL